MTRIQQQRRCERKFVQKKNVITCRNETTRDKHLKLIMQPAPPTQWLLIVTYSSLATQTIIERKFDALNANCSTNRNFWRQRRGSRSIIWRENSTDSCEGTHQPVLFGGMNESERRAVQSPQKAGHLTYRRLETDFLQIKNRSPPRKNIHVSVRLADDEAEVRPLSK